MAFLFKKARKYKYCNRIAEYLQIKDDLKYIRCSPLSHTIPKLTAVPSILTKYTSSIRNHFGEKVFQVTFVKNIGDKP